MGNLVTEQGGKTQDRGRCGGRAAFPLGQGKIRRKNSHKFLVILDQGGAKPKRRMSLQKELSPYVHCEHPMEKVA